MDNSFLFRTDALVLCIILFFLMIIMVWVGKVAGKLWRKDEGEPRGGVSSLLGAVFALFGLILAFAFGMSGSRYESVKGVVVNEANNISTAVLRADLYPDSVREAFRNDFKQYLEARIAYYDHLSAWDTAQFFKAREDASKISTAIWNRAVQQSKQPNMLIPSSMMMPALNNMIDITTTREAMLKARVPDPIVYMLFILALASSFIAGFTSATIRRKDWLVIAGFALLSSMVIYMTLDLGRPMRGMIKADKGEEAMIELRKMF
jgi:hypothetical protein